MTTNVNYFCVSEFPRLYKNKQEGKNDFKHTAVNKIFFFSNVVENTFSWDSTASDSGFQVSHVTH